MTSSYDVRTDTICEGWINCWHEGEELETFRSIEDAQAAIDDYMADLRSSFEEGGRESFDEDHEREQLRIFHTLSDEAVG